MIVTDQWLLESRRGVQKDSTFFCCKINTSPSPPPGHVSTQTAILFIFYMYTFKLYFISKLTRIDQNWQKLSKSNQNWQKLIKINSKLKKIDQNWRKSISLKKHCQDWLQRPVFFQSIKIQKLGKMSYFLIGILGQKKEWMIRF